jgi:hypothetical protein
MKESMETYDTQSKSFFNGPSFGSAAMQSQQCNHGARDLRCLVTIIRKLYTQYEKLGALEEMLEPT